VNDVSEIEEIARGLERWNGLLGRQFGPLSRPQRRVMSLLTAGAEIRVGDLAEQLGMTTAGATRMVDTLEDLGYVRRFRVPDTDQRQVRVALTGAGIKALGAANSIFLEQVERTVAGLPATDRKTLARLLETITARQAAPKSARSSD
jgi:DNA-binding MarR family transcriptional regulator